MWSRYKNLKDIIVTENGAAFEDECIEGNVHDPKRLKIYPKSYRTGIFIQTRRYEGKGYFVWTLLDNFEWAEGFHPKFGLVHVNFENQERIVKASGEWYSGFLDGKISADIP